MSSERHFIFELFNDESASGVAYKSKAQKRAIINHLDVVGSITINDLSKEVGLSVPKTASLVTELISDGLLCEQGKIESTGGRRASLYGLVADSCFFIGVEVKRYYINIGLINFKKEMVTIEEQVPYNLENTPQAYEDLVKIIKTFLNGLSVGPSKIVAACVSLGGRINHTTGYSYSYFHFHEAPLSETLEGDLGIKTSIENDTRAMAYGEFNAGAVTNERNVIFINLDYGIGSGILIDGKLYYGKSGFSGEFGHIPMFLNEILCHCGKRGCLETEASGWALLRQTREQLAMGAASALAAKPPELLKLNDVTQAALDDDVLCIELLATLGEKVGRGLAFLTNVFNPELVIVGGTLAETGDLLRLPIKSAMNKYSLNLVNNDTQLRLSKLKERAGVIGGCLLARRRLLSSL
ncbi:MAG: ROK family transcriptional regulator [Bacteroidetes bacterium]|nr:MAG: ROK family transcriptional regulator [Bacteroidota bacterium]